MIVRLQGVSKFFGDFKALNGIDFDVGGGDMVAVEQVDVRPAGGQRRHHPLRDQASQRAPHPAVGGLPEHAGDLASGQRPVRADDGLEHGPVESARDDPQG